MSSGAWPGREFSEACGSGGRVGTNFAVFAFSGDAMKGADINDTAWGVLISADAHVASIQIKNVCPAAPQQVP